MNAPAFTRRRFTGGLGALVVAFSLDPNLALGQERLPGSLQNNRKLDGWIRINPDGSATVFTGKVELGQGILTALAQIAAEEIDLPLARVRMISGDTRQTPNEGQTAGSQSIENSGTALRMACAEARAILIDLAAKRLGVAADQLKVTDGVVSAPDGRKIGYGELNADLNREATAKATPRPPASHKIVGKSIARFDIPAKVTGGLVYVQDMRPAGMLHGRVIRPPRYGVEARQRSTKRPPRRYRAWLRWCGTALSSASWPSAKSRRSRRAKRCAKARSGHWDPSCPIPRASSR